MVQNTILVDLKRCMGCHACELACESENNGKQYINVLEWGPHEIRGKLLILHIPWFSEGCSSCKERVNEGLQLPCIEACPSEALSLKSEEKTTKYYSKKRYVVSSD